VPGIGRADRIGTGVAAALPPTSAVTPYTAPEVAAGGPPTARSDIFSFGAVAYEMLTGRPAFQGESPEVLAESILRSNPRPSGVPSADRFLRCCSKGTRARASSTCKRLSWSSRY